MFSPLKIGSSLFIRLIDVHLRLHLHLAQVQVSPVKFGFSKHFLRLAPTSEVSMCRVE